VCIAISSFITAGVVVLGVLVFSPWVKSTCTHLISLRFAAVVLFREHCLVTNVMVSSVLWWIQGLGYVKAAITVIKYSPQVFINYKLQSTGAPHYHISCFKIHVRLGAHAYLLFFWVVTPTQRAGPSGKCCWMWSAASSRSSRMDSPPSIRVSLHDRKHPSQSVDQFSHSHPRAPTTITR
jgi:hypothetical protein